MENFADDKENRQYNAATNAIRAQSDLYDKMITRGVELGIIQQPRSKEAAQKDPSKLLEALKAEHDKISSLIAEVEISEKKRVTFKVNRASKKLKDCEIIDA